MGLICSYLFVNALNYSLFLNLCSQNKDTITDLALPKPVTLPEDIFYFLYASFYKYFIIKSQILQEVNTSFENFLLLPSLGNPYPSSLINI